ncbi:MAG TPA: 2-oxo acid dehydrogenase [Bdellovibrionales bacterium]|nr:MAG: hypothetical protein A2Z97_04485 [Bdellovibrionales bacterium GWB1_52_6]OFZ06329.1 MAG: hypothetical protein A2X97_02595 [Bdellovibrionales bacterium GWA1_52_35]OFZ39722.1 MAG: hypothetical protein A2070_12750 [Bdellovibrionales bacterium GWC1_52_8]HAR42371.1 2-oxo acid dehydrogenase [Bdellovibrionales bacterium]HCM40080.1 2-oxo acid dehydrogenase [Bdellovibrionales bacterium]
MPFFTRNVKLGRPLRVGSRRIIALGTWGSAGDPTVYGAADYDAAPALAYIDKLRAQTGKRITLSHFVGKALALTVAQHPDINCVLRFGRFYPRQSVDVCFLVAADSAGQDLSGTIIRNADKKSISDFVTEMETNVEAIRKKGDPAFKKMKSTMSLVPGILARAVIKFSELLMYALNLWTPLLGTPRDPFGSIMITNIGSLGLDMAFAPLVPYSRVPLLISIGAVRETPVVRDQQIVIGKMLRLTVTFDHRLVDGVQMAKMAETLANIFANPEARMGSV